MNSAVDNYYAHVLKKRAERTAQLKKEIPFLREVSREQIIDVTHGAGGYDQFIFWISPSGDKVLEAPKGHIAKPPYGDKSILKSPTHKGWLRGRVARLPEGRQIIVVYTEPEDFLKDTYKMYQLRNGLNRFPITIDDDAAVVDSSGDILGTVTDVRDEY